MKNLYLLPAMAVLLVITSCDKIFSPKDNTCAQIQALTVTGKSQVFIDSAIVFRVADVDGNRIFRWIGPHHFETSSPFVSIGNAGLKNEGWYYLNVSSNGCDTKFDSIYIDILLQQGTPPCSVALNTATYNNLANDAYRNTDKLIDRSSGLLTLEGSGGSNITVYFHPEWLTKEPEDGIYTTINTSSFHPIDADYNKVFISTVKSNIFWASWPDQKVYVSHVAGKLQVRFCTLNFGGYNGTSFTTKVSGNILEQ